MLNILFITSCYIVADAPSVICPANVSFSLCCIIEKSRAVLLFSLTSRIAQHQVMLWSNYLISKLGLYIPV